MTAENADANAQKTMPGSSGLPLLGQTLGFLKDCFGFIERGAAQHGPVFRASILGRSTAIMVGPEACARWIDPECIDHLGRPGPRGEVQEECPRTVGNIGRVLAGQAQPDVVLGQQHVGDPPPRFRFVIPNPDQLRRGQPGQRVVARDLDQPAGADGVPDPVALGARPLVVPQDRRSDDLARPVQDNRAVHLAGQADRGNRIGGRADRGEGCLHGDLRGVPP